MKVYIHPKCTSCQAPLESFGFKQVDHASYDKVVGWLHKPHAAGFFHGKGLRNTLTDLEAQATSGSPWRQHWVASKDGVQFGYLITSLVEPNGSENPRFAKHMNPGDSAITLDVLIGEEKYLGQGLASGMIRSFLLDKFPQETKIFIDPEAANARAIHVYEKVGFRKLEQFIAEWHPVPHWQMMIEMEDLCRPSKSLPT